MRARNLSRQDGVGLGLVLAATLLAFHGVLENAFLNWDDGQALVANRSLDSPGVVGWALTTTHMSHYQPLSWLAWAGVRRVLGTAPEAHHLASLVLHVANAGLVYLLALRLASALNLTTPARAVAAVGSALLFAVHPLRVEPVAWASGFPYVLALAPLLLSTVAYVHHARSPGGAPPWLALSVALYAISLLCRAVAPGFPLALLLLDVALARAAGGPGWGRLAAEKVPYALLALVATLVEGSARRFAPLGRVGVGARLSDAVIAPFVYLYRTAYPVDLSPLDPLPLDPRTSWAALLAGITLLLLVSAWAIRERSRRPALCAAWFAYLVLLGPALGLAPSGLQATADRYTYFPGVVVSLVVGAGLGTAWTSLRARTVAGAAFSAAVVLLGAATVHQVRVWRDSITLWTRAVALNPRNDIAFYNLAAALEEAGDETGAAARYRETLALVRDHGPARQRLDRIEARQLEREANDLAASGRLQEAVTVYGRALERDRQRARARASRGVALFQLGRFEEAVADLREAVSSGAEPDVANALALALVETGRRTEARGVLQEARARSPEDVGLAHNLARVLATDPERNADGAAEAVRLARWVAERTDGRDPRALDTLAAALAATGRLDLAAQATAQAADEARRQGRPDLAAVIEANGRSYLTRKR